MSGASVPMRSLWFGEGLTSATTEDSGRNSDATIRHRQDACRSRSHLHKTKGSRQEAAIVQKQCDETSSAARPRSDCGESRDIVADKLKKRQPGRLIADPAVQPRDAFVPLTLLTRRSQQYATHSSAPTTRDLVNVPRTPLLASCLRSGRARRHPGGRRPANAARRACRRLVVLEVRRVLELVLGPADLELDHGGVVVAAGHGGVAT